MRSWRMAQDPEVQTIHLSLPHAPERVTVGYAQYGDPAGHPVLYFHGWPGSRLQAQIGDEPASRLGIRLLALDRAGFGLTSVNAASTLSQWATLVEAFCLALKLPPVGVFGVSGGGPYALACAARLPTRVTQVAICCGAPPPEYLLRNDAFPLAFRGLLGLHRRRPDLIKPLLHLASLAVRKLPTERLIGLWARQLVAPDRDVLANPQFRSIIARSSREGFRCGGAGAHRDAKTLISPWDFCLADVHAPTAFWYGGRDPITPAHLCREGLSAISNASFHTFPEEGHYSMPMKYAENILAPLSRSH